MRKKEIKPFDSMEQAEERINNILNPEQTAKSFEEETEPIMDEVRAIFGSTTEPEPEPEQTNPEQSANVFDAPVAEAPFFGMGFHSVPEGVSMTIDEALAHCVDADGNKGDDPTAKKPIAGIPMDVLERLQNGESVNVTLNPQDLITSHVATYNERTNNIYGIVSPSYGIIQNTTALQPLDLMLNCNLHGDNPRLVSAGMAGMGKVYLQYELPQDATAHRILGDNSDTKTYLTFYNSFDGSSACGYKVSFIRIVCRNTYMANVGSKYGFKFYHKSRVNEQLDLTKIGNHDKMMALIQSADIFQTAYFERMQAYANEQVNEQFINRICSNLFLNLDDAEMLELAKQYDYNMAIMPIAESQKDESGNTILDKSGKKVKTFGISTRAKNQYTLFRDTLESGVGQDSLRGSKAWLFNGVTNYYNNAVSYGSANDSDTTRALKRFDAISGGTANKKMQMALELIGA